MDVSYRRFGAFAVSVVAVFVLWLYLHRIWGGPVTERSILPILPRFSEIKQNVIMVRNGFSDGYARSVLGYGLFAMMSAFFLSFGKSMVKYVLAEDLPSLGLFERFAIYFMVGSFLAGQLWLGLGSTGLLNQAAGSIVGLIGLGWFLRQFVWGGKWKNISNDLRDHFSRLGWMGTVGAALIVGLLLMVSASAILPQTYSDTLFAHLSLPSFYIHQGSTAVYPFNIYTYHYQNLEMLVIWPILFKSEMAASLLMWGYLVCMVSLCWGFLDRFTKSMAASFSAVLILASAPVVLWFSAAIKNDFPSGLFLFAHYLALIGAIDRGQQPDKQTLRWFVLSGILCGAAIGFKLTALIPTLISLAILAARDIRLTHVDRSGVRKGAPVNSFLSGKYSLVFGAAVLLSVLPWILRSLAGSGNPFYPFLSEYLPSSLVKPWHSADYTATTHQEGWAGWIRYFGLLIGTYVQGETIFAPNWGPTALWGVLALVCVGSNVSAGFRIALLSCILGWTASLFYALEVRYHIGMICFLFVVPFAFLFADSMRVNRFKKITVAFTILTVGLCFWQSFYRSRKPDVILHSLALMVAGHTPGNLDVYKVDAQAANVRWMGHILNTRTQKNESILLAGVHYSFGIDRKIYFSNDRDLQFIADLANMSSDSRDLNDRIAALGVSQIIIDYAYLNGLKEHSNDLLRLNEGVMTKIRGLLANHAAYRFETPDGRIVWYTLKNFGLADPVSLNSDDAARHPFMFLEQARSYLRAGNTAESARLADIALSVPMSRPNSSSAHLLKAKLQRAVKDYDGAEQSIRSSIQAMSNYPIPYLDLASLYVESGRPEKAPELIRTAVRYGGERILNNHPDYSSLKKIPLKIN